MAAIVNSYRIHNAEMRKRNIITRASTAEHVTAVPTMVLTICESEGRATAHAHIRVYPFWRLRVVLAGSVKVKTRNTYCAAVKHAA